MSDSPDPELDRMLAALSPQRRPGTWVWCTLAIQAALDDGVRPVATMRESEGLTVVVDQETAAARGWRVAFRSAWITLGVHSDLQAVGLTAAVSQAIAQAGIACNVVAGVHHDHLFVPLDRAGDAMRILTELQSG